ncbi:MULTISPECIES: isoprenylcysteine carboxylmethyltransferase family protein [unclassified Streptomyces]|uniref:methyltransferase family protein n=1 Tax=unclassified Streptomyces TaxID=2593676 RepID=UPI002DDB70D0|nr:MULTISPECIES: isoprenylcysteine carboxylmethyltransferase family protein [unclassified Streptomyces]WSA91442.1 isoprenylcysteine carboxylmethyltransferase family protein [Streptomyces sp. NBC_01795]WSS15949.1 isoprenylcysteine carboxylmethyltransferase family protein [Streptomyces sp. NBC_01186]WSS44767.1 isoprenylcysteine carboxylmethyltransferase family protein [Streptomyces sp. NBC_01187]
MNAWAWTALLLYLGWTAFAFGVRAAQQRHRTGDAGFRGISGRPGQPSWWAGVLFVAALLGGLASPTAALAGLPPLPGTDAPALHWSGLAITLAGLAGTVAAQTNMGTSWRVGVDPGERTALVTDGLFAHVRNPVFTAMATASLGLTLIVPNWVSLTALAALVIAIQLQVRVVEEPYLTAVHDPDYAGYTTRTGRFLPGIGRRTP